MTSQLPVGERGRQVYDRWAGVSGVYAVVDRLTRSLRRAAVGALELSAGAVALDLGCGPGDSLDLLGAATGADGRIVGVDYSTGMCDRAADAAASVSGASVVRADAGSLPIADGCVDGVLASLSLSTMPHLDAVLAEVRRVLRPDGRLAVVDARTPDAGIGSVLDRVYSRLVNYQGVDVVARLRAAFPSVEVRRTFDGGLGVVAIAAPT